MCVHIRHCCKEHGCKYGEADCPVQTGIAKQEGPCQQCEEGDWQEYNESKALDAVLDGTKQNVGEIEENTLSYLCKLYLKVSKELKLYENTLSKPPQKPTFCTVKQWNDYIDVITDTKEKIRQKEIELHAATEQLKELMPHDVKIKYKDEAGVFWMVIVTNSGIDIQMAGVR